MYIMRRFSCADVLHSYYQPCKDCLIYVAFRHIYLLFFSIMLLIESIKIYFVSFIVISDDE